MALLSFVVNSTIQMLGQEMKLLMVSNDELGKLRNTLSSIQVVLADAEKRQVDDNEIRDWLAKLGAVAYDADDLLDAFSTEALRGNSMKARKVCFNSSRLVYVFSMSYQLKGIRKNLDVIAAKRTELGLIEEVPKEARVGNRTRQTDHWEMTYSLAGEEKIIGREDAKEEIVGRLLDFTGVEDAPIIRISGIAGVGKTTLAQLVFKDEQIKKRFETQVWVSVSAGFQVKVFVEMILGSQTNKKREDLEMITQIEKLRKEIEGKRYLIVLDGVENWDGEGNALKKLLRAGARGRRILLTTRQENVLETKQIDEYYSLEGLDEDDSWNLFKHIAFREGQEPENPHIAEIGKKFVGKCAGVPLAIKTIASLLSSKLKTEWSSFMKTEFARICEEENVSIAILKLSYDHLPSNLKPCFAYCSLFPKDYEIDVQMLINLWMAEGFITPLDLGERALEDVGYEYFMDLLHRSFFQEVQRHELGTIRSCKMHDLVHELATSVAGVESMRSTTFGKEIGKNILHVSFSFHSDSVQDRSIRFHKKNRLRTFLLPFQSQLPYEEKLSKSICDLIISSFKLLRVLDLHDLGIKTIPKYISELTHLRYLDLSNNRIKMLPGSITKLQNLQTLKLSDCHLLKELPKYIKNLISLRHLAIDGCWRLTHMPVQLGKLTSLQTLPRFVLSENYGSVSGHSGGLSELKNLNNLRGNLDILCLKHLKDAVLDAKTANMGEKRNLQALRLEWKNGSEEDEKLLDYLQPHPNLKKLFVLGFSGVKFSSWLSSLTNLVEFTLFNCPKCQSLPQLDQLPLLKYLSLDSLSALEYVSDKRLLSSSTSTAFFPSLDTVILKDLPTLKKWWMRDVILDDIAFGKSISEDHENLRHVELHSFPCLSKLSISFCPKLTSMPRYPYLDEELVLDNASLMLQETIMMIDMAAPELLKTVLRTPTMSSSSSFSTPASSSFSPLSNLKSLIISKIDDLESLPEECLQNLTSLKKLEICFCPRLKSLSKVIQYLTTVEHLQIEECKEFDLSDDLDQSNYDEMQRQGLSSLRSLVIGGIPKLVALPRWLQNVFTLQDLHILRCPSFVGLPDWTDSFTSLQQLVIMGCPNLASLPEGMGGLTSLQMLKISGSPLIPQRCKKEIGEDWPKIAHIPYIEIEYKRYGEYVSYWTPNIEAGRSSYAKSKKNFKS